MDALFPRWTNSLARASLGALAMILVGVPLLLMGWVRTPYVTGVGMQMPQPIQFDHRHHVRDDGIDCLYCHSYAERSDYAGIPSSDTCIGCHSQIWNDSPILAAVRRSVATNEPIYWLRVHDLPDHVYFSHQAHVNRGVGCESCHGRVDLMGVVYKAEPLTMGWCLACHRSPAAQLRPPSEITTMGYRAPPEVGAALQASLDIQPPTHCTGCHR